MDFLNPEEVIGQLDLKPDMMAVDFGSGSGRISLPLAKKLEDGLVWAIDIQKQPLMFFKNRCLKENINNVNFLCCDIESGSKLNGSFFDLALAVDILFQVKNINAIISEAKRILKRKGILFISDKFNGAAPFKVLGAAKESGFILKKEINLGENRYGLIFEKV